MSSTEDLLDMIKALKIDTGNRLRANPYMLPSAKESYKHQIEAFDELSDIVRRYGEIVHCGECRYSEECPLPDMRQCNVGHMTVEPDDFCKYSERRDKEGDNG